MSLPSLPEELLLPIISQLDSDGDIFALARANRQLYQRVIERVYEYNIQHKQSFALLWYGTHGWKPPFDRLVALGADVNTTDASTLEGETPLGNAVRANQTDMVSRLLKLGASSDLTGHPEIMTPIHLAASPRCNRIEIVQLILDSGANVTRSIGIYGTPLHVLARNKGGSERNITSAKIILLLKHGANIHQTDNRNVSAVRMAALWDQTEIVRQFLLLSGVEEDGLLHAAANEGSEGLVEALLEAGHNANRLYQKELPIQIAARRGFDKVVEILLQYGADLRASVFPNQWGESSAFGIPGSIHSLSSDPHNRAIIEMLLDQSRRENRTN